MQGRARECLPFILPMVCIGVFMLHLSILFTLPLACVPLAAVLSSASHARLSYAGLGCTLLWLAMARKALPALPVSIALAVAFYFISRFVMEPVILPMTLELIYF